MFALPIFVMTGNPSSVNKEFSTQKRKLRLRWRVGGTITNQGTSTMFDNLFIQQMDAHRRKTIFIREQIAIKLARILEEEALGASRLSLPLATTITRTPVGMVNDGRFIISWQVENDGRKMIRFYDYVV